MGNSSSKQSRKGKGKEKNSRRDGRNQVAPARTIPSAPTPGRFPDFQPPLATYRPGERPSPSPPRMISRANSARVVSTTTSNGDPFYLESSGRPATASRSTTNRNRDVRATEIIDIYLEQPWSRSSSSNTRPTAPSPTRPSASRDRGHRAIRSPSRDRVRERARSPSRDRNRRITVWPGPNAPRQVSRDRSRARARSPPPSRGGASRDHRVRSPQRPSTSQGTATSSLRGRPPPSFNGAYIATPGARARSASASAQRHPLLSPSSSSSRQHDPPSSSATTRSPLGPDRRAPQPLSNRRILSIAQRPAVPERSGRTRTTREDVRRRR